MIFGRVILGFFLVTIAAFFCAQPVEAAKGPKITHKVYFDIKHGDKDMGRSESLSSRSCRTVTNLCISCDGSLWRSTLHYVKGVYT